MLVRQDLSPSQQAVQACHACLEFSKRFPWVDEHPHLVLVGVPDEATLSHWAALLPLSKTVCFYEPDLNNSLTALATSAAGRDRSYFRSLKLLNLSGATVMGLFQGRFGFHPCSYQTYRKLKRLNFLALQAKQRLAAWKRWNRKDPQNRLLWRYHDKTTIHTGHVTKTQRKGGTKIVLGPAPEPCVAPIALDYDFINAEYRKARFPAIETQVQPLKLTEAEIEALLATLEQWYQPVLSTILT